jgi:hypothetical protein
MLQTQGNLEVTPLVDNGMNVYARRLGLGLCDRRVEREEGGDQVGI